MRFFRWLAVACLIPVSLSRGDEPAARYEVVTPKLDGIVATGINGRGDVIGFDWTPDPEHPGVIEQAPFLARGGKQTRLPLLPTYTSTFPAAVSDTGLVVGRASKPGSTRARVLMQNQAFVWTEADGIRPLPSFPDDLASFATGISRDGLWVSGLVIAENRMTPCVWGQVQEAGRPTWKITLLPQEDRICSNAVAISGDGRRVAALDGSIPTLWTRTGFTKWTAEPIGPLHAIHPRAINDAGTIAGIITPPDGSTHAVVWTRSGGVQRIRELTGYTRSEASAINTAGAIVGMIDGPAGTPFTPRPFVFANGHLRILDEGGPNFTTATAINDRDQVAGVFEAEEEAEPAKSAKPMIPQQ